MRCILTHEQADFDALSSSLAAWLLDESAVAILPQRVNRNVRAFLTLYGSELPFVEQRDLPVEPIEALTLVDTQSLISLKGISRQTHVKVIDHHSLRPDLPASWELNLEEVGACTTLLVEALHEQNGPLLPLQATLMLLGIYEDCGSLTYASTTVRDVQAAAYLLEQGASLKILNQFLNPPLTVQQRDLYDRLLNAGEMLQINGKNIFIAAADGRDVGDEISSVAHKLRDLLEPDALFQVVLTPEGIRMIARSNTEAINVAEVLSHFGGGGHERAASALIKVSSQAVEDTVQLDLQAVVSELRRVLPQKVKPSITVTELMSRNPLTIDPDAPVEQVAALMQRYGYEGIPVVENGRLVGLVTRREVDHALAHKLSLPARSLMEAGEVAVFPPDPVEHVQQVMADSGWGQVPVLDPRSRSIMGIITRTDVIKALGGEGEGLTGRENLTSQLASALPPPRFGLLRLIGQKGETFHLSAYVVGGFVRDLLLGLPSTDFDIVVEGDALELVNALVEAYGGRAVRHRRFGTAKWELNGARDQLADLLSPRGEISVQDLPASLDFISARMEFYEYPSALPTVQRASIKMDLHRRDFTINTMAIRLDGRHFGELYDYWGGLNDLRRGIVRVLHSLSFVDDPTRMIRAVRFEQRFGFAIEGRTLELMQDARSLLRQVSGDRLRHELNLILQEEHAPEMIARLDELGLLKAIHPALGWDPALEAALRRALFEPIDPAWGLADELGSLALPGALGYLVWLSALDEEQAMAVSERLHFPRALAQAVQVMPRLKQKAGALAQARPADVVQGLEKVPLAAIYALFCLDPQADAAPVLREYAVTWRHVRPHATGERLKELGLPAGPRYAAMLKALRAAWLNGEVHSAEEEEALLRRWLGIEQVEA
jgi:tRNA nucleotidyltransferase (CCA-adding enzyme)